MPGARFRGGCTLIIDLATAEVRYMVRKKVDSPWRLREAIRFVPTTSAMALHGNYFERSDRCSRTLRDDPSRAWIGDVQWRAQQRRNGSQKTAKKTTRKRGAAPDAATARQRRRRRGRQAPPPQWRLGHGATGRKSGCIARG